MQFYTNPLIIMFDRGHSREEYNEWVIRNQYSKQVPVESQVVGMQSTQYDRRFYRFDVSASYENTNNRQSNEKTIVLLARVKLNHENWPLFQHFVRLLTDPFIYIRDVELIPRNDVLNSLVATIDPDHGRVQCRKLKFNLDGNAQKTISWMKNHLRCEKLSIISNGCLNHDEKVFDFFVTGANCTSKISICYCVHSRVIVDLVQKFMGLKDSDENQMIESIQGNVACSVGEVLKSSYAKYMVEEGRWKDDLDLIYQIFEFVNSNIGKKLRLTNHHDHYFASTFWIKITHL
ncbi:hypothetical protein Ddc_20945 [Ditylenchus destructor]|nr:hypothetical protein Ddc_20945 [Ditylenchus destructor]